MPAINRFSKIRPAKFNPLTADEIMRVPMLKGALEQEQLSLVEGARLDMLNAKIAPGDKARVMKEQDRLTEGFDSLVSDITTNGVGYKTTSNINNYMKDYNTSMSSSGVIGGATDYYANRKEERKSAKQNAIRNNYDMASYSSMEANYDNQQSSFDEEGKQSYGEYEGFYLPEHIDIGKLLEAEVDELGGMSVTKTDGSMVSNNWNNLKKAQEIVSRKFATLDSYKKLKQYGNYSDEYIANQLRDKALVMAESANKEATYRKPEKPDTPDEEDVDPGDTERLVSERAGALAGAKYDLSNRGRAEAYSKASDDTEAFHDYKDFYNKSMDKFEEQPGVSELNAEIAAKETAITATAVKLGKYSDTKALALEKLALTDETHTSSGFGAGKKESYTSNDYKIVEVSTKGLSMEGVTPAETSVGYIITPKESEEYLAYQAAVDSKEKQFQAFAGPESLHHYGKTFSINTSSAQSGSGKNKAQTARYREGVAIAARAVTVPDLVNVTIGGKEVGNVEKTEVEGETLENNELVKERMKNLQEDDIQSIEHQLGSKYNLPSIRLTFEALDAKGKNKVLYAVTMQQPTSLRNLTGAELRTNRDPFNMSMTSNLDINKETRALAEQYINNGDTKGITAGYKRTDYTTSANLKHVLSSTAQGRKFIKDLGNIAISETKSGKFVISELSGQGDDSLEVRQLYEANGLSLPKNGNISAAENYTNEKWAQLIKDADLNLLVIKAIRAKTIAMSSESGTPVEIRDVMYALLTDQSDLLLDSKENLIDILK